MTIAMSFCLKAATTLQDRDLDALTASIEHYSRAGMDMAQAEEHAIADLLAAVETEKSDMVGLLRDQHAEVFNLLTNPTVQGLREKEAREKAAAAADQAEQKRLADKAKADAEVGEFTLTGSDRAADAPGQGGLPGMSLSDVDRIPVAEAIEAGPVPEGHAEELQKIQDAYRASVPAYRNLKLQALPEVAKPDASASQATKERYAAQELAKVLGNELGFFAANLQQFAEGMAPQGKKRVIFINEATSRPVMALLGHELTHSMRVSHPGLYDKLADRLAYLLEHPEKHDKWLNAMYVKRGIPALSDEKLREELIADIVGDAFTDPKAMRRMLLAVSDGQPNLFQRVLAAIRDFLDGVLAQLKNERPYATGRYLKDVAAARDVVTDIMAEFAGRQAAKSAPEAQPVDARELALASPNTEPFFSELVRQAEAVPMKAAPASGWLEWLKGIQSKGVKADEIAWTGIEDWLKLQPGKVTRDQVLEYLKANGVQVTETMLGEQAKSKEVDRIRAQLDALGYTLEESGNDFPWVLVQRSTGSEFTYSNMHDELLPTTDDEDSEPDAHEDEAALDLARELSDLDVSEFNDKEIPGATKYGQYTLPGGQNYQELLLTLPSKNLDARKAVFDEYQPRVDAIYKKLDQAVGYESARLTNELRALQDERNAKADAAGGKAGQSTYRSSHWEQPNILAHVRFNERTDADGKRVLFIEEIQSDWAQEGKKKGFSPKDLKNPTDDEVRRFFDLREGADPAEYRDEMVEMLARGKRETLMVPNAPFVGKTDAWVALAVKRMVRYAVDHDFDRVAFVNGDQSAERYDLSKQIGAIEYERGDDDTFELVAKDLSGKEVLNEDGISIDRVEELVGKEIAKKIANEEGELNDLGGWAVYSEGERIFEAKNKADAQEYADVYSGTASVKPFSGGYRDWRTLSGLDLKVGGEGMKAFYDKIVPKVVKEVTKKLGGQIGATSVVSRDTIRGNEEYTYSTLTDLTTTGPKYSVTRVDNDEVAAGPFKTWEEANAWVLANDPVLQTKQLAIDITPKMRETAAAGLPMFSVAPQVLPPREGLARAFQRKFQDAFNRFTTVRNWAEKRGVRMGKDSDVWAYEERMHGRIATRVEDFREKRVRPAIQAIQKAGFGMAQVAEFLHAQHAEERNKQIETIDPKNKEGAGMSTADAQAILAKADPKLAALANDFRKITDETRDILLKAGIINQEMVDAWQGAYKHYVPLKGGDDEKAAQTGTGKGLNVAGKQKRALGHAERDEHIIENIMRDHERAIALAEKNRVGHSLLSFITDLANEDVATIGQPERRKVLKQSTQYEVKEGNGARIGIFDSLNGAKGFINYSRQNGLLSGFGSPLIIVPVKGDPSVAFMASPQLAENEVNVYVKGHTVRVQLHDELLARAYTRSGIERLNQLMAINRAINTFLSKAYTGYNPEFFFTNVLRDFTTGLINVTGNFGSKITARAVAGYPKAFATLIRYSVTGKDTPAIKAYRAAGGSTGAAYLSDIERIGRDIQASYDEYQGVMATLKGRGAVAAGRVAARKMAGSVLSILEHLNAAGESAMRLSVFESVRTTPGFSEDDAASAAKNSTVNFNRRGEWGPVMGALYLFFNPGIQGTAAIMDTLVHGKNKRQAWALAAALPALAYMLAAGQFGGGDDDDETWMGIPDSTKDKNLVIRTGPKSYITIPVPYGYGFLYSLGNALHALRRGKDVDKVSLNVASNLLEHFSPVGNPLGDKLDTRGLAELVPGAVGGELMRDAVRLAVNRSGLGGDIVPDSPFDQGKPDNLRMFRSSKGSIYEKVAKAANAATGGTASLPGHVDVSPETLKFWVRAITGGSGAFLSDTATLGANAIRYAAKPDDPDRQALKPEKNEIPIVRRFAKDETINDRRRLFWEAVKEVDTAKADLQRARKLDDEAGEQRVQDERGELLAMGAFTKAQTAAVKAQRDAVEEVMADTTTSLAFKRARVKELEDEERVLYNDYVREFSSARKEARRERVKEAATP